MKAALRWRRPADHVPEELADPAAPAPTRENEPDPDTQLQSRWTGGPALATKAATGVLWTGLLTGPAALFLAFSGAVGSAAPVTRPTAPVVDRVGEQAAAAEFAGRVVRLWLTSVRGQEAQLTPLLRGVQVSLPQVAWSAGPATVADERRLPDGTWMVVTAVPVGPAGSAAATAGATVRYFQVPVHLDAGGPVALALPAPVAAPGVAAQSPRLGYRYRATQDDPAAVSVQQFLTALIAGAGDVTRYLSPGTAISAVTPAPYTSVAVTDIATDLELTPGAAVPADGTHLRALATATATGDPQQQATVQYPLTLTVRGGRWEITAVDATPALLPPAAVPAAASRPPATSTPAAPAPSTPGAPTEQLPTPGTTAPSAPAPPSQPVTPTSTFSSPDPLLD